MGGESKDLKQQIYKQRININLNKNYDFYGFCL